MPKERHLRLSLAYTQTHMHAHLPTHEHHMLQSEPKVQEKPWSRSHRLFGVLHAVIDTAVAQSLVETALKLTS